MQNKGIISVIAAIVILVIGSAFLCYETNKLKGEIKLGAALVAVKYGGTSTSTTPKSGQVLIGNASNTYNVAWITAGQNIQVSTSSGSITIASIVGDWSTTTGPTIYYLNDIMMGASSSASAGFWYSTSTGLYVRASTTFSATTTFTASTSFSVIPSLVAATPTLQYQISSKAYADDVALSYVDINNATTASETGGWVDWDLGGVCSTSAKAAEIFIKGKSDTDTDKVGVRENGSSANKTVWVSTPATTGDVFTITMTVALNATTVSEIYGDPMVGAGAEFQVIGCWK